MGTIHRLWNNAKIWRSIPLGPVSVIYRMSRTVRVSNNRRRRLLRNFDRHSLLLCRNPIVCSPDASISHPVSSVHFQNLARPETAVVVGVGPGLGFAVGRKLARAGMSVALASRNAERLDPLVRELRSVAGNRACAYGCDATNELSVKDMLSFVVKDIGIPSLIMYSVQGFCPGRALDIEVAAFEENWRQNCLGAFIVAREAARIMAPLGRGTIILTGSPSGVIGRSEHLNLAVGKFGLRALAQVLARELSPKGIHVIHLIIDADIREENEAQDSAEPYARPEDIADLVISLHRQPRSAWTNELDVRPWNESFWEHC